MDITRRRVVRLTVTFTLLSLAAGTAWRPHFGSGRASTHPFVDEFYPNHVRSDGGDRVGDASARASGSFDDGWPSADVLGNEVKAAVAAYKVDPIGTLYEEHSPQTDLPRLAQPRS